MQPKVQAWVSILGGDRLPCIDSYGDISDRLSEVSDSDEMLELFILSRYDTAMRIRVRAAAIISISEDAEKPMGYGAQA